MNPRVLAYKIIRDRKEAAEETARLCREELLSDPVYRDLDSQCRKLCFEIARLGSQNKDIGSLKSEYSELCKQREIRMKELGKTPDDLTAKYHCPICRDTGVTDSGDCVCLKELVYRLIREDVSIPGNGMTPQEVLSSESATDPDHVALYKLLSRYVANYPEVKKIYLLTGAVGVGKSFAAGTVASALSREGYSVLFLGANKLNDMFLQYHLADLQAKSAIFRPLLEAEFMVIDDLGAETLLKNVTANYLYTLLTSREYPTMITTNLAEKELRNRYTDRIFSRLMDVDNSKVLRITGPDLRITKGK